MATYGKIELGLAVLSLAITARAQNPFDTFKQFSATMVMSGIPTHAGEGQGGMKIYRSGDKMRTELPGGAGYTITDLTQRTTYMVMGNGMCMQTTAQGQQNPSAQARNATVERSPAGTETVDGHTCKVENVTVTPQNGQPAKMKLWEAEDLKGFPIKIEIQSNRGPVTVAYTVAYKDVSFSEPEPSLFTEKRRKAPPFRAGDIRRIAKQNRFPLVLD